MDNDLEGKRRRYYDPEKMITVKTYNNVYEAYNREGPIWVLTEHGNKFSSLTEIINDCTLQIKAGKHLEYTISHFNNMALIWNLCITDQEIINRKIMLTKSNALQSALTNSTNHDWRVINLRESLIDYGWAIINIEEEDRLKEYHWLIKNSIQIQGSFTVTTLPLATATNYNLSQTYNNNNNNNNYAQINTTNETTINQLIINTYVQPKLTDYVQINKLTNNKVLSHEQQLLHTTITKSLNNSVGVWQSTPPNWLTGKAMLMLTGLTQNLSTSQLTDGKLTLGAQPIGCTSQNGCNYETYINDNNITNIWNCHTTLHRMFNCNRYLLQRTKLINQLKRVTENQVTNIQGQEQETAELHSQQQRQQQTIDNNEQLKLTKSIINKAMENIRTKQIIIRHLTGVAFEGSSNL